MYRKITVGLFFTFLYCMFVLNILEFVLRDSVSSVQTEAIDNTTFFKSMEQISYGRHFFINVNSIAQNIFHKCVVNDRIGSIVKQKNDYLMAPSIERDVSLTIEALKNTYDCLREEKIDMLYIGARTCVEWQSTDLPVGIQDWDNQVLTDFFSEIEGLEIPYIDSYSTISGSDGVWEDYFFKTDHHWTPEAAFHVYADTCKILESEYNWEIDDKLFHLENYEKRLYKKSFLGAEGRRVGRYYVGLDDFTLITPMYDTNFTLHIPSKGVFREGCFQDTILDPNQPLGTYSYELSAYYKYIGGDYPQVQITNHNVEHGRILVVKDSFGIPYSAFISNIAHETTIVDLRYTEESLRTIIDKTKPDLVIFCYGPGYLGVPSMVSLN